MRYALTTQRPRNFNLTFATAYKSRPAPPRPCTRSGQAPELQLLLLKILIGVHGVGDAPSEGPCTARRRMCLCLETKTGNRTPCLRVCAAEHSNRQFPGKDTISKQWRTLQKPPPMCNPAPLSRLTGCSPACRLCQVASSVLPSARVLVHHVHPLK